MAHHGGEEVRSQHLTAVAATTAAPPRLAVAARHLAPPPPSSSSLLPTVIVGSSQMLHDRGDLITLAQPRPGIARVRNEYIETPLRPPIHSQQLHLVNFGGEGKGVGSGKSSDVMRHGQIGPPVAGVHHHLLPLSHRGGSARHPPPRIDAHVSSNTQQQRHGLPSVVTQQPGHPVGTFQKKKKEDPSPLGKEVQQQRHGELPTSDHGDEDHRESIICAQCQRCKCDACRKPRPLPATWICGSKYQCSAETLVDHCSCMCCVKGIFYHCTKDDLDNDVSCADRPCSCAPHRRCQRWGCVALLSTLLPCLVCYWPLRGFRWACEACYSRYHSRGCQCVRRKTLAMDDDGLIGGGTKVPVRSTKRLLDGVD